MNKLRVLVIWNDEPAGENHCQKVIHIIGTKPYDEVEREIKRWFEENGYNPNTSPNDVQNLTYQVIRDGEAWYKEQYCFSLNEVYG